MEVLGEKHPDALSSMSSLALTNRKQVEEAKKLFVQVMESSKPVLSVGRAVGLVGDH
jgi:hypothetical protein